MVERRKGYGIARFERGRTGVCVCRWIWRDDCFHLYVFVSAKSDSDFCLQQSLFPAL